ncbi:putative beta-defensin 109B [Marmota marmota marmota]|uniref:putative beta-defensin 109B n=1 Tax=Marmota marmota marmota TaxID=9994 RepID=UPI000762577E|nr:putative beta-defensin 109B [Marmota marmota marmota]
MNQLLLVNSRSMIAVRSGLGSGEGHCLGLGGVCRRPTCKVIEELISFCQRKIRCCRKWWILIPVPTPVIYTDYREALKPRIK